MKDRQRVLSDHKRVGNRLVPPFTRIIGPLREVSWIKTIIPELIWICLLHNQHGDRRAVEIITQLSRHARRLAGDNSNKWLAPISHYSVLSFADYDQIRFELRQQNNLDPLLAALKPLICWYPECPLHHLFLQQPASPSKKEDLQAIKNAVGSLYGRFDRGPMMVQATAIWLAFDARVLKVTADQSLAHFPEIENYPATEISEQIGASIRASLNLFFGTQIHYSESKWPSYFWNRGITIDRCETME